MISNERPDTTAHAIYPHLSTQKDYDHLVAQFPHGACEVQRVSLLHTIHDFRHDTEAAQDHRLGNERVNKPDHQAQACTRKQGVQSERPCPPLSQAQLFEFFGMAAGAASGARHHERAQAKCQSNGDGDGTSEKYVLSRTNEADPEDLSMWDKHCLPTFLARRLGRAVDGSDLDGFQIHLDSVLESADADARLSAVFARLSTHRKSLPRVDSDSPAK